MRGRLVATAAVVGLLVAPLAACSDSSVMHMRVGQCILLPEGSEETTATTLETTGCTREHDAEVFHIDSMPDGDFPGAVELQQAGRVGVHRGVRRLRGFGLPDVDPGCDVDDSDKGIVGEKDRSIVCLARPLDHSKLTSSVKESGL